MFTMSMECVNIGLAFIFFIFAGEDAKTIFDADQDEDLLFT